MESEIKKTGFDRKAYNLKYCKIYYEKNKDKQKASILEKYHEKRKNDVCVVMEYINTMTTEDLKKAIEDYVKTEQSVKNITHLLNVFQKLKTHSQS